MQSGATVSTEEFVGPFANWISAKTGKRVDGTGSTVCTGATGNGSTDDTAAIQSCLNLLNNGTQSTIYFPSGTYKVTSTLILGAPACTGSSPGASYINMVGQDPSTTSIVWGGSSGGTIMCLNGVNYSRFDRLTFNGSSTANIAVDQSWSGSCTGNCADTANQFGDDVFENAGYGYLCGNQGAQCSESAMIRDQFLNNTIAGVALKNFNALDVWVWNSTFKNNNVAIGNNTGGGGAGNFHVYNSIFQGSTTVDIQTGNTGIFNIRGNYSVGSQLFFDALTFNGPDPVNMQGNTILDTVNPLSVYMQNMGPMVLIDNVIRGNTSGTPPAVAVPGFSTFGDLFSVGNTFTAGTVLVCTSSSSAITATGHCHSTNDQIVARTSVLPSCVSPTWTCLPSFPTPPNNGRTIFEITPGSSTAQIQTAINNAASGCANNVAHLQAATYSITSTLVIPTNCAVQIIGDGQLSKLQNGGASPIISCGGTSGSGNVCKATLRELNVNAAGSDGIIISNADQSGSRVWAEGVQLRGSSTNLFVDALDNTNVELHDFSYNYDTAVPNTPSINVTGGASAQAGTWLGGATTIFSGTGSLSYSVSLAGHLEFQAVWYDGGDHTLANITGVNTAYTSCCGENASGCPSGNNISLANFQGNATVTGMDFAPKCSPLAYTTINLTGNGSGGNVLVLGSTGANSPFFNNSSSPAATTQFLTNLNSCQPNGTSGCTVPANQGAIEMTEVPSTPNVAQLTSALSQMRGSQPTVPGALGAGITDFRMYRAYVDNATGGHTGLHIAH